MEHQAWASLEALEPRLLMSSSAYSNLGISPLWFEDLLPDWQPSNPDSVAGVAVFLDADGSHEQDMLVRASTNQWIVQLTKAGIGLSGSVSGVETLLDLDTLGGQVIRGLGSDGMVLVESDPDTDPNQFQQTLYGHASVEYVEADLVLQMQGVPDDAFFTSLWGLHNVGQNGGTVDADIDAPEAWALATGAAQIVVGVIDTGVDYTHGDLALNTWTNPGELPDNNIDDDGNGFVDDVHGYDFAGNDGDPMDDHGHGTHVAGTIAGIGNNGLGIAGVNWASSIMALKFLSANGSGRSSDAVRAVNYTTMMRTQYGVNVRLTNNSWGGGGFYRPLRDAIASSLQADMLFVAAAGNDGQNTDLAPHYPSNYNLANIISVAATDRNDQLAWFSNYGISTVDLAAPGVSIVSTVPNGGYASFSGTSMASPHVAGVAALAWSVAPTADFNQIRDAIYTSVDPISSLAGNVGTGGRLNAYTTLISLSVAPDPNPDPNPTPDPNPALPGDSYEIDDTQSLARSIMPNGVPQYHTIHVGTDIDWVRFKLNESSSVVMATGGGSGDTRMWLYSGDNLNSPLAFDNDSGVGLFSQIQRTSSDPLEAGTYYLKIDEFGNNTTIDFYTITVTATALPEGDQFEGDDSPAQASALVTDGTFATHSIHVGTDIDWMTFSLDIRSDVILQTDGIAGDTRMWLYGPDSFTRQIAYDDDDGVGFFSKIVRAGSQTLEAGTYHVKVDEFGNNNAIDSYTISVTATPAAPDLLVRNVSYWAGRYTLGSSMDLAVELLNQGAASIQGGDAFVVTVHLSSDVVWDNQDDIALLVAVESGGLDTGQWISRTLAGLVPDGAAEGDYYVGVWIDRDDAIGEIDETNNIWWSRSADVSLSSSLVLTFDHHTSTQYTDAKGGTVRVVLRGPGHGEVQIKDGRVELRLFDTTESSSLYVKTDSQSDQTSVNQITVDGSLRRLVGHTTDLNGDVSITGSLDRMVFDDVIGPSSITIGPSQARTAGTVIRFDRVAEASIDSAMRIRRLRVNDWDDDNTVPDRVSALSLGSLVSHHDFGADVHLTDAEASRTLGRMYVRHRLYDALIESAGHVGAVNVGSMTNASVFAGVSATLADMPESPGDFSVLASIGMFKIRGRPELAGPSYSNSNVVAATLGHVRLEGVLKDNAGGSFGVVADTIKSYRRLDSTGRVLLRGLDTPGPADVHGDFLVRLI